MIEKYSLEKAQDEAEILRKKVESGESLTYSEAEKEIFWNKKFLEVQAYKDGAGNKMDEGIMETVTALNANEIPTIQSCAGHIEKNMMPWVQIQQPGRPKGIYKKSDITPEWEEWRRREEALEERVKQLLEEFISDRETSSGVTLMLNESNTIVATNKDIKEISASDPSGSRPLTKQEEVKLKTLIPLAQEEMRAFCAFLKGKFFEKQK